MSQPTRQLSHKRIEFNAMEFQQEACFKSVSYIYQGSEESGWTIFRDHKDYLSLPPGYRLLKTLRCGICSTDMARAQLPFPLPQITGHEVLALDNGKPVVVDINASHYAIGDTSDCFYCNNGLSNHCPERLTLGIDRLPGGFAPYILVPKNSIIPLPPGLDPELAVIAEPLAAAIHAAETSPLKYAQSVAVIGPGRLGSLLLLALYYLRKQEGLNFFITAIIRRPGKARLCKAAGADHVLMASDLLDKKYDIVFDTSGSISGFETALQIAKDVVHLKSTNGQPYAGLTVLTRLVIDEISIQPLREGGFSVLAEKYQDILIDQRLGTKLTNHNDGLTAYYNDANSIPRPANKTGQYDAIVIADIMDLNLLLAPGNALSYLKPKGTVYVCPHNNSIPENPLADILIKQNLQLQTSRCGDFNKALNLMVREGKMLEGFARHFFTNNYSVSELNQAFAEAKSNKSFVKAVVLF